MEVISVSENNIEKWSTLKEVQEYLGVGRETILQWIAKRNMPAYKVGRLWKFKFSELDEWIRSGGADEQTDKTKTEDTNND
jgi:excisionase family DNA binding protein